MGLLDDAIREHLELKRRHGADPGEVSRQEQEALGPARRGPEPLEVADGAPQEEAATATADAPAPEELADPALIDPHVDAPDDREPEPEPAPVEEPAAEAAAPPPPAEIEWEAPEPVEERAEEPAAPEPEDHGAGQPTVAFDAADVAEAQRREAPAPPPEPEPAVPPADEDVLEETPDFLQETPEHDRLWFEQRPPRDFDFDG